MTCNPCVNCRYLKVCVYSPVHILHSKFSNMSVVDTFDIIMKSIRRELNAYGFCSNIYRLLRPMNIIFMPKRWNMTRISRKPIHGKFVCIGEGQLKWRRKKNENNSKLNWNIGGIFISSAFMLSNEISFSFGLHRMKTVINTQRWSTCEYVTVSTLNKRAHSHTHTKYSCRLRIMCSTKSTATRSLD